MLVSKVIKRNNFKKFNPRKSGCFAVFQILSQPPNNPDTPDTPPTSDHLVSLFGCPSPFLPKVTFLLYSPLLDQNTNPSLYRQVGDRLFSAFGQDTVDSLFWTATEPKNRKRDHAGVIPHFLLTVIYVMAHTLLVLVQATCLNVAINASNKSLLTIMLSNNVST